jgi:hypothetical protein
MTNTYLRKFRALSLLALGVTMLIVFVPKNTNGATTVTSTDFQAQSFSKVVDWYDYVRAYAQQNGFNTTAIQNEHAYIYANYINVGGFQLFYSGLVNATHNGQFFTIPIQTFFEHFKTPGGKDAITASSFISLVAFNETRTGDPYPNSPDHTDTVYASFSLGVNLTALPNHPTYVATSNIIPLTSTDQNHWTWGLNYTNLNAIWWKINPDPNPLLNTWDANLPRGLAQYSQLTFNYALAIDPTAKTATLTTSYTVGRVTDLYLLTTHPAIHLNSTGTYNLNGSLNSTQTVNQFLQARQMKLSIVLSQKTILATPVTDKTTTGASVDNDNSTDVTHSAVTTFAPDGESIAKADFGVKSSYNLYNTTSGQTTQYSVNTRTVSRSAWGGNPVFWLQNTFMGFLPLFVAHVDPGLLQAARTGTANFVVADYLYIISYPTWGGYKIVNDPQYQAFYQPASNLGLLTAIFIAIAVAAGIGGVFAFLFRRRRTANMAMAGTTTQAPPNPSPAPTSGPPGPTR